MRLPSGTIRKSIMFILTLLVVLGMFGGGAMAQGRPRIPRVSWTVWFRGSPYIPTRCSRRFSRPPRFQIRFPMQPDGRTSIIT